MNILGFRQTNEFKDLAAQCQEIGKSSVHSYCNKLVNLLRTMFPQQRNSQINSLFDDAINSTTTKWVKKMNTLIEIFLPNREFGEALIINRDLRTDFRNLNIGAQYQAFFNTKEVVTSLGVKKEMNILTLPIFECFFTKVVCELLNLKQYEKKGSWKESFQNDDFYYFILRNPLLHIIRQWLIYTRTRLFVFNRILNVLELLLIRQPIFRFRKGESSLSIKTYHFYGIYLLIEWKTTSLVWEFLSFIVDYLETKQKNFNFLFCCWVRLHLILLRRGSPYELSVRKDLEDGLRSMVLSKVRITSVDAFGNQVRGIQDHDYLDNLFIQVDSLLSKELWTNTAPFLAAVLTILFMKPDERRFSSSLITQLGKVIQKIDNTFKKKDDAYMKSIMDEVKQKYKNFGCLDSEEAVEESNVNGKYSQKGSLYLEENKGSNKPSNIRGSFVSYHRPISVWEGPLKSSESHLFYGLGFVAARSIDKLIGKESAYPTTNLRFLASYKAIAVILACIIIVILLFY